MNHLDRDSLRARLRAGDPYQGEPMPGSNAARIRARMRAAAEGGHALPSWVPAAAAAMVAVVALGVWLGSRPSTPEGQLPGTPDGAAVAELPSEPVTTSQLPQVPETVQTEPAVVHPAPALPELAAAGPMVMAPPETAVAADQAPRTETLRIRFTAPGGTRIVWTLDPDFDPGTTRNDAPPARHQQGANDKW